MNMNFNNAYIFIFFIYGLSFFSMGISALQQSVPGGSNFPIAKYIKYLGCFGIIHGVMEWILMIRIAQGISNASVSLMVVSIFLNAASFAYLLLFGIKLLNYRGKHYKIIELIPIFLFSVWFIIFIAIITFMKNNFMYYLFIDDIAARYFIGFPGGIITAIALITNARELKEFPIKKMARKYYALAIPFAVYGVLAGLIVDKKHFFPANILNKELFRSIFGFPVELGRAIAAITITILFIGIIDLIKWESNEKMSMLLEKNILDDERKRLGQELHDVVIQNIFATGLQVENLIETIENQEHKNDLTIIKTSLNHTIEQVRGFIKEVSSRNENIEGLKSKLKELLDNYERITRISISMNFELSDLVVKDISSVKLTQIYYIIQEAVSNSIKHSGATKIEVSIMPRGKFIQVSIKDNGKGFHKEAVFTELNYGLITMKERASSVNSQLLINSNNKGTEVILHVPREVKSNIEKNNKHTIS